MRQVAERASISIGTAIARGDEDARIAGAPAMRSLCSHRQKSPSATLPSGTILILTLRMFFKAGGFFACKTPGEQTQKPGGGMLLRKATRVGALGDARNIKHRRGSSETWHCPGKHQKKKKKTSSPHMTPTPLSAAQQAKHTCPTRWQQLPQPENSKVPHPTEWAPKKITRQVEIVFNAWALWSNSCQNKRWRLRPPNIGTFLKYLCVWRTKFQGLQRCHACWKPLST